MAPGHNLGISGKLIIAEGERGRAHGWSHVPSSRAPESSNSQHTPSADAAVLEAGGDRYQTLTLGWTSFIWDPWLEEPYPEPKAGSPHSTQDTWVHRLCPLPPEAARASPRWKVLPWTELKPAVLPTLHSASTQWGSYWSILPNSQQEQHQAYIISSREPRKWEHSPPCFMRPA